jgi:glycosyltransferase involved in cell wall biosynthesis
LFLEKSNNILNSSYPLVTVFTLIYNTNPKFVIEAIESVRANNYPNLQHIIIDDCSPNPEPKEIVKHWILKENYQCEFYEHEVNYGLSKTLNHVLYLSKGEFILGCCDDILMPNRIIRDVEFLKANKNAAISFGKCLYIDEHSIEIDSSYNMDKIHEKLNKMPDSLLKENFIIAPSVTYRKEKLIKIGGFQTEFIIEDYPTWLEFLKFGYELSFQNEYTVRYRINPTGFSIKKELLMLLEDLKIKIKYSTPNNKNHLRYIRSHSFKVALKYPKSYKELIKIYRGSNDRILYYWILKVCCMPIINLMINLLRRIQIRLIK